MAFVVELNINPLFKYHSAYDAFYLILDITLSTMDNEKMPSLSESEIQYLKEGLKRTYKERFEFATSLYKTHLTMKKAVITHKPATKK
ncbi:hypothetical protein BC343_03735 [Mucilaginibacter pedocola]|uniref:Uncharacterized protein n=2 Tax=Mucilaginibacter pedocola TaxID=1792845 RepID=A0A1S9PMK3_9SPHI|nr:hypothetical protein BC343_03735 [Mucilaginibacter pedocola]